MTCLFLNRIFSPVDLRTISQCLSCRIAVVLPLMFFVRSVIACTAKDAPLRQVAIVAGVYTLSPFLRSCQDK